MKKMMFLLLVLIAGCATGNDYYWAKPGSSSSDFSQDQGQCHSQAFSLVGAPLVQRVVVFESCMSGKGWYKQAK